MKFFIAVAAAAHDMPAPIKGSQEFDRLKALAGKWRVASTDPKMGGSVTEWAVTSGGNAITEKLSVGTPHEMISVYYPAGDTVGMTHYCMLPNRPEMRLSKITPDTLEFAADVMRSGIKSEDLHMHALTMKWKGKDHITETWTSWEKGKAGESTIFEMSRAK